jgi:hypothetical protein
MRRSIAGMHRIEDGCLPAADAIKATWLATRGDRMSTTIGLMIYAAPGQERSVFRDEKYRLLAEALVGTGARVEDVLYHSSRAAALREELSGLDALLVWVNPIEQGEDRSALDRLLVELHRAGVAVSAHPDTIMKLGTKRVLYDTRDLPWGGDVELYPTAADFRARFPGALAAGQTRVLKQYGGDGGNGVFKVRAAGPDLIAMLHAKRGSAEQMLDTEAFFAEFQAYFSGGRPLISQPWNEQITNGMVRCYMTADQVVGFGYQEINALYPTADGVVAPGRRYYYTERCALFADLRELMEKQWIGALAERFGLAREQLPVIWDADFFIEEISARPPRRYTLCEINVSCVSPFPESAIPHIASEALRRADR